MREVWVFVHKLVSLLLVVNSRAVKTNITFLVFIQLEKGGIFFYTATIMASLKKQLCNVNSGVQPLLITALE